MHVEGNTSAFVGASVELSTSFEVNTYKGVAQLVGKKKETKDKQTEYKNGVVVAKNKKLFDYVYGCRMDNGDRSTEDGSDYFGVGFIHLTGKNKYKALDDKWNKLYPNDKKDFMGDDISLLKTSVDVAMKASMIIWSHVQNETNKKADKGNNDSAITVVTLDVNGGNNGLDMRKKFTKKGYEILKDEK